MKVWVKTTFPARYQEPDSRWELGTIVGVQTAKRYIERPGMAESMTGETFWTEKRYLIETDNTKQPIEAWASDTYPEAKIERGEGGTAAATEAWLDEEIEDGR